MKLKMVNEQCLSEKVNRILSSGGFNRRGGVNYKCISSVTDFSVAAFLEFIITKRTFCIWFSFYVMSSKLVFFSSYFWLQLVAYNFVTVN